MKRIGLFLCINFVVLITIGFLVRLFGVDHWLTQEGIDYNQLLAFSAILGFTGSFISLMMSKTLAKLSVGARVIVQPQTEEEKWLVQVVRDLSDQARIKMPEVAVYSGSANAFATGAFKNDALVAVSTGLLQSMTRSQVRAVLAHEMSHVKNGDMVTMTLIQGVLNTFVFFFARVIAASLNSSKNDNGRRRSSGSGYYFTVQIFELLFGILASIVACAFSRRREYKADAGAAELLGSPKDMIEALQALDRTKIQPLPSEMKAFGIVDMPSFAELFSTHPSLQNRIEALSSGLPGGNVIQKKEKRSGGLFGTVSGSRDRGTPWN
ncbi:MAG: protease HtpX [Alphaproteobacteria bacterium]|nr:protease HtpX [Alphaproteobacteria bacterium]